MLDQQAAEVSGINRNEMRAIELVSRSGKVTAGQLAKQLGLSNGAVTGLVDRLEKEHCLRRLADPSDRRRVLIELTPEGRRWERRAFGDLVKSFAKTLSRYNDQDLAVIIDFLRAAQGAADAQRGRLRSLRSLKKSTRIVHTNQNR